MKVFALLFLVGCAFATQSEWRWESGKQHVFEYSGRLLTGLPQLASHYSGLGINATVLIDVLSQNKLQLSLENPRFARVNERLEARMHTEDGRDGANWRKVFLPQMSEVAPEFQRLLAQPIVVELVNGEIRQAQISREEPEWSINFKKALALLFQTKFDAAPWQPEDNQIRTSSENFWKTKEESIDGICEVTYQVNELPEYMIRDRPDLVPYPQECQQRQYYEVVKTKNVDNCEKRAAFSFFKPGQFSCNGPNCKNMWARTSETRYVACGTRRNMVIQTIVNQGELNQNLLGLQAERFVSGNMQILRLKEVRTSSPKPQPSGLIKLKDMRFEYTYQSYQNEQQQQQEEQLHSRVPREVLQEVQELAKTLPRSMLLGQKESLPKAKIMQEVKTLMQTIITDLSSHKENLAEKQVAMKLLSVARGLGMLKKSDIESMYQQLKAEFSSDEAHKTTAKNLFYDSVMMSGTPEAIRFLKEQMERNEMSKLELFSLFYWLPHNLMLPTQEVLEEVYQLVMSQKIQECRMSQNIATMSFTTLLEKACLAKNREVTYPTWVFGEFCNPDSPIVTEKWIPYLFKELETAQHWNRKNEVIVALGMLPKQQIIGKLVPYLEAAQQQQQEVPSMTRLLALWSLAMAAVQYPQTIEPIFFSLYANPAEATEIRISAFNALLKINPSMGTFHKIAARTWTERDQEVLRAVNTALMSLQRESYVQGTAHENIQVMTLSRKARMTYPLIKKTDGSIFFVSASHYAADFLPKLDSGYESVASWITSKKSILPRDVYYQITYFLSQYQFTPIAVGYRLEGAENIYRRMAELLAPQKEGESVEQQQQEIARQLEQSLNSEWRKIVEKLNIKSRIDSDNVSGAGFFRLQEATPLFGNFHELTVKSIKELINDLFQNPQALKEKILANEHKLVFRRTINLSPYMALIPTDMGFPLNIEVHYPIVVSMDSRVKIESLLPKPQLKMESRFFYTAQLSGWVGTLIPFTREFAVTAIDNANSVNLPATMKFTIDLPNQHVKMTLKMDDRMTQTTDLVHHHIHPMTTIQKIDDFTPITLSQEKKFIKSRDELKDIKKEFGESFGLQMVSQLRTESRYVDLRSVVERMSIFNYNPLNMFIFRWARFAMGSEARPSFRRSEYFLRIDPSQSATKEVSLDLKMGYASKEQESQTVKYHKIKILSEAEQKQSVEQEQDIAKKQLKKLVPISIESEEVEAKRMHPERQEKIEKVLKSLEVSPEASSKAFAIKASVTLQGSRPKTYSYASVIAGVSKPEPSQRKYQSNWLVQLMCKQTNSMIVLKGNLQSPVLPVWDIHAIRSSMVDYRFYNSIQFVKDGSKKWAVDIDTKAQTTHEQKEHSRKSAEAKLCQRLTQEKESSPEQNQQVLAKLSQACEYMREQARTLDEVQVTVKYENVPRSFEWAESRAMEMFKTVMWPYLRMDTKMQKAEVSIKSSPVYTRIQFHKTTPSFDLTIERPEGKMQFKQVRTPYPLNYILPLKADVNNVKLVAQQLSARSLYPVCKIEGNAIQTFDNRSLPLKMDKCFHLLTADCTHQQQFGVLLREQQQQGQRQLQIFLGRSEIKISPEQSELKVEVDGQQRQIRSNQWQELRSSQQEVLAQVLKTQNKVVKIYAPQYSLALTFDGQDIAIEASQYLKGQMCGLCGNQNLQSKDEMQGPQECMHSKPEIEVAAYRVPYPQGCDQEQPLSAHIKQKLQEENQQCIKDKTIHTKLSKSMKTQNGQCTVLKHAVLRRANEICISKKAVTQCAAGCQPSHAQLLEKQIPFFCMKEDRVAEHYGKKAERGERLPELDSRPTTFETKVPQPRSCVPASNSL